MRKKLFLHHHIFKNAGTSLDRALKNIFGETMYFFDSEKPGGVINNKMLTDFVVQNVKQDVAALSSHQSCLSSSPIAGFEVISFVILRDPLQRFLSMYNYHKKTDLKTKLDFLAKELSFRDFILWIIQNSRLVSSNFQTNFCSKTGPYPQNISTQELLVAKENLLRTAGVGIVERFDDSLVLFNRILNKHQIPGKLESYQENKSDRQVDTMGFIEEQLGAELIREIKGLNALDYELYAYGNSLMDKKLT
ncbi:MAG: sulfotransferase family 2 domain-containing protein [Bacteroidales bacterium]|nr:sulfotransferase family 2 domain-containing protein [Bacteroidales bacterium]